MTQPSEATAFEKTSGSDVSSPKRQILDVRVLETSAGPALTFIMAEVSIREEKRNVN